MNIVVFTPTFNRAHLLRRVYSSLVRQTFSHFYWLIIDDGSDDDTKLVVNELIDEGKLKIEYHFKQNGGKYTAIQKACQIANAEYIIILDSDDELEDNAIEIFANCWNDIKIQGNENEYAEIKAGTRLKEGPPVGKWEFPNGVKFIDSTWHEMVLKLRNDNEMISCARLAELKKVTEISKDTFLTKDFRYLSEFVFWARYSKLKIRFLNENLRTYYVDSNNSIMRNTNSLVGFNDDLVSYKIFCEENFNYFLWRPKYYLNLIFKYQICCFILNLPILTVFPKKSSRKYKLTFILLTIPSFLIYIYMIYSKKKFWR